MPRHNWSFYPGGMQGGMNLGVLATDIAELVRTGHHPGLGEPTALSR